jgi:hypothetical protein
MRDDYEGMGIGVLMTVVICRRPAQTLTSMSSMTQLCMQPHYVAESNLWRHLDQRLKWLLLERTDVKTSPSTAVWCGGL